MLWNHFSSETNVIDVIKQIKSLIFQQQKISRMATSLPLDWLKGDVRRVFLWIDSHGASLLHFAFLTSANISHLVFGKCQSKTKLFSYVFSNQ